MFTHGEHSEETIEMTVVTEQPDGLLLWHGQTDDDDDDASNSKDFITVVVSDGRVQFRLFRSFAADDA